MEKQKLISIVIPTYNRGNVLPYTLSLLKEQVLRNLGDVELIICDNASTDETQQILENELVDISWFKNIKYTEFVDATTSLFRAVENATGKFIWLWGDDDVPAPMMIDVVLSELKKYPHIGLMTFNDLIGYSDSSLQLRGLYVEGGRNTFEQYEQLYSDSTMFAEKFYEHMGFISVDIIRKEVWEKGLRNIDINNLFGYCDLTVMFSGAMGYECLYLQYPLCIQRYVRKGGNEHEFSSVELGLYQFISIPRALKNLNEIGAITSWEQCFRNYIPNQWDDYFYDQIVAMANNPKQYSQYYAEIIDYQSNPQRVAYARRLFASVGTYYYPMVKSIVKFKAKGGFKKIRRYIGKMVRKIF